MIVYVRDTGTEYDGQFVDIGDGSTRLVIPTAGLNVVAEPSGYITVDNTGANVPIWEPVDHTPRLPPERTALVAIDNAIKQIPDAVWTRSERTKAGDVLRVIERLAADCLAAQYDAALKAGVTPQGFDLEETTT